MHCAGDLFIWQQGLFGLTYMGREQLRVEQRDLLLGLLLLAAVNLMVTLLLLQALRGLEGGAFRAQDSSLSWALCAGEREML